MTIEALFHRSESSQIMMGSIGWEDEDEYYFLGTEENDGYTFVRVQLFEGRDTTQPINPNRAQGRKIICHISSLMGFRVPPKDTRVFVAVPKGMEHSPGAGVIVAAIEKSPVTQFEKDRVVIDYGPDTHVVIKGKSVTLQDPDYRFLAVGSPRSGGTAGVHIHLPDGTGAAWQDGAVAIFSRDGTMLQMTPSKWEVWQKQSGFTKLEGGEFWTFAPTAKVQGNVFLGKNPTLTTKVLYGSAGAELPSGSVFVSAT